MTGLERLLSIYEFKIISTQKELKDYFDVETLDADGVPKITTEKNTIIITDNMKFNNTYFIDIVNKTLHKFDVMPDLIYINNVNLRKFIQCPRKKYEGSLMEFESKNLPPIIITINIERNELCKIDEPIMGTFTTDLVNKIFDTNF